MWKRFNFFDKAQLSPEDPSAPHGDDGHGGAPSSASSSRHFFPEDATCCCSMGESRIHGRDGEAPSEGMVTFGCDGGQVCSMSSGWRTACMFQAYDGRTMFLHHLRQRNILVTLGLDNAGVADEAGQHPKQVVTIKMWDYDRLNPSSGPICLKNIRTPFTHTKDNQQQEQQEEGQKREERVISFAVTEEKLPNVTVALGLSSGAVFVLRGDVVRDSRVTRARIAIGGSASPGTSDSASGGAQGSPVTGLGFAAEDESLLLFAVTKGMTEGYNLGPTGTSRSPLRLFQDLEGANVDCSVMTRDGTMAVGRTEAVFIYGVDGRGPCFVFEGEKVKLMWFHRYLLSLSKRKQTDREVLTIYDLKNKLIAFTCEVEGVAHIVYEWDVLHVLMHDQEKSFVLSEKAMKTKLELLFRKSLYNVAIQLTQHDDASRQQDNAVLADIHRKYGDHLYYKQDFDNAMEQYILTIGEVEPSYIIRKFLDAQRIPNLASYLESLHHHGMANADHTTLLLNCYTKLKDVSKLDAFIHVDSSVQPEEYMRRFDIETAIKVCRSSGYYDHALYVAERSNETGWYLRILLEDCQRYEDALHYLSSIDSKDAVDSLKKYGKMLVTSRPEETTALLMRLCTPGAQQGESPHAAAQPSDFTHLFAEQPRALMVFFEYVLNSGAEPSSEGTLYSTLLELYLTPKLSESVTDPMAPSAPVWQDSPSAAVKQQQRLANAKEYPERLEKALALMKRGWPTGGSVKPKYDAQHALVICHLHSFKKGIVFLYERMQMYKEVLKVYMDENDCAGLLEAITRLGDENYGGDSRLWIDVLEFFGRYDGDCSDEVKQVLHHIEAGNLLPPIIVLQILSRNTHLTLSVVKDYVARILSNESAVIEEDKKAIQKYRKEAANMQKELHELKTEARVFQNSKCSACSAPLELPAVHFLCMHSYHSRCLGENERECPICAPQNYTILDMRRSQRATIADPDKFFTQLQHSADGFAVVAEYFGRGLMNL